MALYPGEEGERRFPQDDLHKAVAAIFVHCGMEQADADLLADTLVRGDLKGVHSHGVMRVPDYVNKLTVEGVNPQGRPRVVRDDGAALVVDGDNAMGQVSASFAMRRAIEKARDVNVCFAAIGGSNHCGALDYYTEMALAEDMIGVASTNALPTMAPWGGRDRIVGLNPISFAIPAGDMAPLILDTALGATAHGKIRIYGQKEQPIPEGWAFDAAGRPTTDPIQAAAGLIQPVGGFKGVGLALVMGVLSSLLSGAAYGTELGSVDDGPIAGRDGHFVMALKIAAFEDLARFKARMDSVISQYHATGLAPGFERVYIPGDLEREIAIRNRERGIPLNAETLAGISASAIGVGADASLFR